MMDFPNSDELDEGPLSIDLEELGDDSGSQTLPCPVCGAEVYEEAERCPHCREHIVAGGERGDGSLWQVLLWMVLGAAVLILLVRVSC